MAVFIGRLADVGIAKESSRGVGVAAQYSLPKTNITFDDKVNKAVSEEGLGSIVGYGNQAIVTQQFSEGNIDGEINANSFGLIMLALFGGDTPTTVQTSATKHTFALSNSNAHQTLSIHGSDPVADRIFEGCMLDSLDIDISLEKIVNFSASFKGKKGQDSTFTPSYSADYKFVGRDLVFKVAADTASLAAASAVSLKELKLSFKKHAEHDFILGTIEPEAGLNKQIIIEGTLKLNYEAVTMRDYMLNGTYRAMSILLSQTRDTLGTGGSSLYFEFPRVDFFEWERERANDDPVTQTINFRCLYDLTTSKVISDCYIINMVASY